MTYNIVIKFTQDCMQWFALQYTGKLTTNFAASSFELHVQQNPAYKNLGFPKLA